MSYKSALYTTLQRRFWKIGLVPSVPKIVQKVLDNKMATLVEINGKFHCMLRGMC